MSTTTTLTLNYARFRNAKRKNNKSIHELSDSTNTRHLHSSSTQDPPNSTSKPSNKHILPTPKSQTNDLMNMFGQTFYTGNLDYISSLIQDNKSASNKNRDKSGPRPRGPHNRSKSTMIDLTMGPMKVKPVTNENQDPIGSVNTIQNISTIQTVCATTQASSLKPDLCTENEVIMLKMDTVSSPEQKNFLGRCDPNNTPTRKEGKLFEQFFQKGGVMKRSMSVEDLRLEKRKAFAEYNDDHNEQYVGRHTSSRVLHNKGGRNSEMKGRKGIEGMDQDFLDCIDGYIGYFGKEGEMSPKGRQKIKNEYYVNSDGKGSELIRRELEQAQKELKNMKKQMEMMQLKVNEVAKINKHLIKELSSVRSREEECQQRMKDMEEDFVKISERRDFYKHKLVKAEEQLEIERVDNENNLLALKKLIASNIKTAMNHKVPTHQGYQGHQVHQAHQGHQQGSHMRGKSRIEDDYLKNLIREGMYQKKENVGFSAVKEKKPTKGDYSLFNNRYEIDQKLMKNKSKIDIITEDDESTYRDLGYKQGSKASSRYIGVTDSDSEYQEGFMDGGYQGISYNQNHNMSKDQQIQFLKEKLEELADNSQMSTYEKDMSQRSTKKNNPKRNSEVKASNFSHKKKEDSFMAPKGMNGSVKYEYYMNGRGMMKNREEEMMDETSSFGYIPKESD